MDNHPLWFNAIAVEALLHHGVLRVDALPLLAAELLLTRTVVVGRRFIHVVLTLVVPIHDGVIQLQLWSHTEFQLVWRLTACPPVLLEDKSSPCGQKYGVGGVVSPVAR